MEKKIKTLNKRFHKIETEKPKPVENSDPTLEDLISVARGGGRSSCRKESSPLRNEVDMYASSVRVRELEIQVTQLFKIVELLQLKEDDSRVDVGGIIFTGEDDLLI